MTHLIGPITRTAALLTLLYGARRYYRNWGTTKSECRMVLPGDKLVADPAVQSTEAIDIDAPTAAVWPWLLQMGQDRAGFYGCEGAMNAIGLGYHHTDRVHSEWQRLAVRDTVRLAPEGWLGQPDGLTFSVTEIVPEKYLVLHATTSKPASDVVWSFHVQPHWEDRVRLLTRVRIALRRPGAVFAMELARPLIAFGTRSLLLGIKHRVEASSGIPHTHARY
ncbi:hypothetical protein BN1232_02306 [Mycobacterium lentiflavum]|uniref:Polyketide cyclase / dehydrase and lipid transport n=1 Tax=Mycobacterium lentiflavum TaxID=141349 RepID=A0A0E4GXJ1_MYCLN|nr:hypothetical protein [Mycobacterium lentiflavum]CQD12150.1 hypothetical protein BN1232_02306 [Mycobacterium lentiflavum]